MVFTQSNTVERKTTFTPLDQPEPKKTCTGKCKRTMESSKFGFKYGIRDGVKGKVRNSSCLDCRNGATKIRDTNFQSETKTRTSSLEHTATLLQESLEAERTKNEKLQLLFLKFSAELESLGLTVKALSEEIKIIKDKDQKKNDSSN